MFLFLYRPAQLDRHRADLISSESDRQFNASLTVLRLHWKIASSFFLISVSAKIFAIFNI